MEASKTTRTGSTILLIVSLGLLVLSGVVASLNKEPAATAALATVGIAGLVIAHVGLARK